MRLFIAILFDEKIKDALYDTMIRLQDYAKGSFTARENLHLTVNFIGETNRLEEIKVAMEHAVCSTETGQFQLSIGGFGKFKRDKEDIYWIGVEKVEALWGLQRELTQKLKEAGFDNIDDREYKPHITLGRKIHVKQGFQPKEFEAGLVPMQMEVPRISLMKSERLQGKLVYTEIYHVNLG